MFEKGYYPRINARTRRVASKKIEEGDTSYIEGLGQAFAQLTFNEALALAHACDTKGASASRAGSDLWFGEKHGVDFRVHYDNDGVAVSVQLCCTDIIIHASRAEEVILL
jgi:hypothetical protein